MMLDRLLRKPSTRIVVGVFAGSCALLSVAGPAQASTTPGADAASRRVVQQHVADALRVNPGSRQISATTVELAPGVEMTVAGAVSAAADSSCASGRLCLWQDVYRGGAKLAFYYCKSEWLGDYSYVDYRDGKRKSWRDSVSSIWNNQTGGALSAFYNYHLLGDTLVGYLSAGNYLQDLTRDASRDGGSWNDKIDRVTVC